MSFIRGWWSECKAEFEQCTSAPIILPFSGNCLYSSVCRITPKQPSSTHMDALPNYSRIIHNLVRQTANDEVKFTDRMQYHRPAMYQAAFDVSGVCTRLISSFL